MKFKFKLESSTRSTSHLTSLCNIYCKPATLGEDYGLTNLIFYQAKGFDTEALFMLQIVYKDGKILGPFLGAAKRRGKTKLDIIHLSRTESWTMSFTDINR